MPIVAGILFFGVASSFTFARVKNHQFNKKQQASEAALQKTIADNNKNTVAKDQKQDLDQQNLQSTDQKTEHSTDPAQKKTPSANNPKQPVKSATPLPTSTPSPTALPKPAGTLSLVPVYGTNVAWSLNGNALYGLKLVWSISPGPVYPGSSSKDYPSSSTTSATINTGAGNYYVRVCMYYEDGCMNYSNEVYINVP